MIYQDLDWQKIDRAARDGFNFLNELPFHELGIGSKEYPPKELRSLHLEAVISFGN